LHFFAGSGRAEQAQSPETTGGGESIRTPEGPIRRERNEANRKKPFDFLTKKKSYFFQKSLPKEGACQKRAQLEARIYQRGGIGQPSCFLWDPQMHCSSRKNFRNKMAAP